MSRQLAWPPRLAWTPDGKAIVAEVEQDSPEEITGGVALLCELRPGDLQWDDDLGIPDPIASINPSRTAGEIEQAIGAVEDRLEFDATITPTRNGRELHLQVRS